MAQKSALGFHVSSVILRSLGQPAVAPRLFAAAKSGDATRHVSHHVVQCSASQGPTAAYSTILRVPIAQANMAARSQHHLHRACRTTEVHERLVAQTVVRPVGSQSTESMR